MQQEILQGFRKFYPKNKHKRQFIDAAGGITWKIGADRKSGCFVLTDANNVPLVDNDIEITVSKKCSSFNKEAEIKQACRGSIHFEQIIAFKNDNDTEVDHCNQGGFETIYRNWRSHTVDTMDQLYDQVVKNDVLNPETTKIGYLTFKEPILGQWKAFHLKHAQLQELSKDEHRHVTKKRRCSRMA